MVGGFARERRTTATSGSGASSATLGAVAAVVLLLFVREAGGRLLFQVLRTKREETTRVMRVCV